MFFYLYAIIELLAIFLDSNVIPTANVSYPVGTVLRKSWSSNDGTLSVVCCCIHRSGGSSIRLSTRQRFRGLPICRRRHTTISLGLFNALHGLSPRLIRSPPQLLRIVCLVVFGVSFFVGIATFKGFASFTYAKPLALWIIYILWPLICTVIYIVSQLILVFRTLEDRWPIGDIVFGTAFFTIAQVIMFAFSVTICDAIKHYIDGLFFFTLCMLLSVMMVYKYWDSITVRSFHLFRLPIFHILMRPCERPSAERGPGVLRRIQGHSMGGQRSAPGGCRRARLCRGHGERLQRPRQPCGRGQRSADIPQRWRTWLSTTWREILIQ